MSTKSITPDVSAATIGADTLPRTATAPAHPRRMPRTFASLKHHNYRLYVTGQLISQIGTWMQQVAQGWLVYQLTGSPLYLGLVGFFGAIPMWFFALSAGALVDRFSRRRVLLTTQSVAMLLALILAGLVFTHVVQPWHILVLAFLLGINNSFDGTARQTFVKDMVGKEDMLNAIALNSAIFNLSRIVGPALAGITLAAVGPAWCFLLNGLSYLAVILGIFRMQLPHVVSTRRSGSMLSDIKEGIRYIRQTPTVSTLMLVIAISAIFAVPYTTLLPAYASDVMHVDAQGFGFLSTATGIGALCGALMMASLSHTRRKGVLLTVGNLIYPVSIVLLSLSRSYPLSLLILAVTGWSFMTQQATANTLVQSSVPDHLRGRVMSVYMLMGFSGMQPIGAMQAGAVAEHFGVPAGIGVGASIALIFSLLILWRVPRLRRME